MRTGVTYRRCSRCSRTVQDPKARRCPLCGGDRVTWAFKVDIAPPGAKRQWRSASGFPSKAAAVEGMARLQTERLDGKYVVPTRLTLGRYVDDWLAGGPTCGWKGNTMRDYRVGVHHIKARFGPAPFRAQSSMRRCREPSWRSKSTATLPTAHHAGASWCSGSAPRSPTRRPSLRPSPTWSHGRWPAPPSGRSVMPWPGLRRPGGSFACQRRHSAAGSPRVPGLGGRPGSPVCRR
jgi:hypothetical protein